LLSERLISVAGQGLLQGEIDQSGAGERTNKGNGKAPQIL